VCSTTTSTSFIKMLSMSKQEQVPFKDKLNVHTY
jgi:hypothetical protein